MLRLAQAGIPIVLIVQYLGSSMTRYKCRLKIVDAILPPNSSNNTKSTKVGRTNLHTLHAL